MISGFVASLYLREYNYIHMITKIILVVPLLTVVFYTFVGIIKREVWIAGPTPAPGMLAKRENGSRALLFGFSFSIIYIFFLFYFITEMQLFFTYAEWFVIISLSGFCSWFVTYLEKKLSDIKDPFKVVVPALAIIAFVSLLMIWYFLLQS